MSAFDLTVFDLPDSPPTAAERALLSADELRRAERLVVPIKRRRVVHARVGLRLRLAERIGCAPETLEFGYGRRGKPYLRDHPGLQFNLSHSASKAALITAEGKRVGIDIENAVRDRRYDAFSKRFFAEEERDWLLASPPATIKDRFYRIWTIKEAYVKALGVGLGLAPRRYAFSLDDPIKATLIRSDAEGPDWELASSLPAPGFVMSTCVEKGES